MTKFWQIRKYRYKLMLICSFWAIHGPLIKYHHTAAAGW